MARPSIYDFAGGDEAFLRLATAHHARCLRDEVLEHPFSHGTHPQHLERLAAYWAEVFGGPSRYSESCGGQSAMLVVHAGNDPEAEMGTRFLRCFLAAVDDVGLPDDPEFRAALRSYMTWAVGEVMAVGPADTSVPAGLPTPRWSWDGVQGAAETSFS